MFQLSQIENALATLSSAKFQKLFDAYLRRQQQWPLQSWSVTVGADKDKTGIPDAYARLPNGQYVLVAYTTTASAKLAAKLHDDLIECIAEAQSLFGPAAVALIALVFNRRLSPKHNQALHQLATLAGYKLLLFGLDDLCAMVREYPPLAYQEIGLDLGVGQFIHAPEFVEAYGRRVGATSLTHSLVGRDQEQAQLAEALASSSLILVHGPAGAGKTQLVVTGCQDYCAQAPASRQLVFVADRSSADFIRELQAILKPGHQVIVVADDANRTPSCFKQLLAEGLHHPLGRLTIVATVRDYAREIIARAARDYAPVSIEVRPLSADHISTFLRQQFQIHHPTYLDRINRIAQGRPRLAIMLANVAKDTNRLKSLHKLSDLYNDFFQPILDDLRTQASTTPYLFETLAIIHFLRVLKRSDQQPFQLLEEAFSMRPDQWWQAATVLDSAELVEMRADRVVRAGDQVLGAVIFYQVFLSDRPLLSYGALLKGFIEWLPSRVSDTLNNAITDYGFDVIKPQVLPELRALLRNPTLTDKARWAYYKTFWPLLGAEIIASANSHLAAISWPQRAPSDYLPATNTTSHWFAESPLLEPLISLASQPTDQQLDALALLVELAAKLPDHFHKVLKQLTAVISFKDRDYDYYGLQSQQAVTTILEAGAADSSQSPFHWWLVAHVIPVALHTHFEQVDAGIERRSIVIRQVPLPQEQEVMTWRQQLWDQLFALYSYNPAWGLQALTAYIDHHHHGDPNSPWKAWDAERLVPFLLTHLDPASFLHGQFILNYLGWLGQQGTHPSLPQIRKRFNSQAIRLYRRLLFDPKYKVASDRKLKKLFGDEREAYLRNWLRPFYRTSLHYYQLFIGIYHDFHPLVEEPHKWQVDTSFTIILQEVIKRDPALGRDVVQLILAAGNPSGTVPGPAIAALAASNYQPGYDLLTRHQYQAKPKWLLCFLTCLPPAAVNSFWLGELYCLLETGQVGIPYWGLQAYAALAPDFYPTLVNKALDAIPPDATHRYDWHALGLIKEVGHTFFPAHLSTLQRLYLWQLDHHNHHDPDGHDLQLLLAHDPAFLLPVLRSRESDEWVFNRHEHRSFRFFWDSDAHHNLVLLALNEATETTHGREDENIAVSLLPGGLAPEAEGRLLTFIEQIVTNPTSSHKLLHLVFAAVMHRHPDHLMAVLAQLLRTFPHNPDQLFQKLRFTPSSRTAGASWVPVHQSDITLWQQVLAVIQQQPRLTNGLRAFRQHVLNQIDFLEQQIEIETERNFCDFD